MVEESESIWWTGGEWKGLESSIIKILWSQDKQDVEETEGNI